MFREMRRFKQQVSQDECKKILKDEKRAAFSVIGDEGYPYTIPINFYYEEADHTIYFHYTIYAQKKRQKFLRISKIVYNFKADWKMET